MLTLILYILILQINIINTTITMIMHYIPAKELPESVFGLKSIESRGSTIYRTIIYTYMAQQYKPHFSSMVPSGVTDQ